MKPNFTFRIDPVYLTALKSVSEITSISMGEIIQMSLELFFKDFDDKGIFSEDLKNYVEISYTERKRKLIGKQRNEFLSRELFLARVVTDLYKIVTLSNSNNIEDKVIEYLNIRKKEAKNYKNSEEVIKDIDVLIETSKNIESLTEHISPMFKNIKYVKFLEKKVKKLAIKEDIK